MDITRRIPPRGSVGRPIPGLAAAGLLAVLALPASASAADPCRAGPPRPGSRRSVPFRPWVAVWTSPAGAGQRPHHAVHDPERGGRPAHAGGRPRGRRAHGVHRLAARGGRRGGGREPAVAHARSRLRGRGLGSGLRHRHVRERHPVLSGTSRVTGLTVNGQAITLPSGDAPFELNVGLATVRVNDQIVAGDRLTRRAVRVVVPGVSDASLGEAVVGGTAAAACTAVRAAVRAAAPAAAPRCRASARAARSWTSLAASPPRQRPGHRDRASLHGPERWQRAAPARGPAAVPVALPLGARAALRCDRPAAGGPHHRDQRRGPHPPPGRQRPG